VINDGPVSKGKTGKEGTWARACPHKAPDNKPFSQVSKRCYLTLVVVWGGGYLCLEAGASDRLGPKPGGSRHSMTASASRKIC
jgi:hypothetical protein